jgi:hypothetical protein
MNRIRIAGAYVALIVASTGSSVATEWYEGATLHEVSSLEWAASDESNRLATASEFIGHFYADNINSLNELRSLSEQMQACIDAEASAAQSSDDIVFDIANKCAIEFGWPNRLTPTSE